MDHDQARARLLAERAEVADSLRDAESAAQRDRAASDVPGDAVDAAQPLVDQGTDEDITQSLRERLNAPSMHAEQSLYVSDALRMTKRVMVKDEDVCLHCGLCAERCPTGAWDMQKSLIEMSYAGKGCRTPQRKAA